MTTPSPTTIDSLARSWDDFVLGHSPDPGFTSSDTGEFLRVLHRDDHSLDADPRFVAGLQREMLSIWQLDHREPHLETESDASSVIRPLPPAVFNHPQKRFRRVPHHAGVLASAALLLLTLISAISLLASAWQPVPDRGDNTTIISAPIVNDPATAIGVLTTVRVPELPPSLALIAIQRWTYPPHADAITTRGLSGPLLLYVIKGEITVALDGGEAMLLGEERGPLSPISSLNASTGRVGPGQSLLLPAHTDMTTSNPGDQDAIVIAAPFILDTIDDWVLPYNQTIVKQVQLGGNTVTYPAESAEITLRREILGAGETLPAPPEGALQLVGAESKFLAYFRRGADGSVTNLEQEPVQALILTVVGDG